VGSILVGILLLSLGILKIVRSTTRLFTDKPTTPRAVTSPSPALKLVSPKTVTPSVAPQSVGKFKTASYPTQNPLITFQVPKEAAAQAETKATACFTYGFVVCVSGDLKETSTFDDNEIKDAEAELTKAMTSTIAEVLQKQGGTGVHVNKTGHFKTAKGVLIFYSEATYKNDKGADMLFLNHLLPSKKGLFVFQGYARQTDKDAFYNEMRRLLDSVGL
jgi:hypothetical protein